MSTLWTPETGVRCTAVLHAALRGVDGRIAEELLIARADVNVGDTGGRAPLHVAAEKGLDGIFSILLLRGLNNALDDHGNSALLMYASGANAQQPHPAVVETLLTAGADANPRCHDSYTALKSDSSSPYAAVQCIQALVRHGIDVNSQTDCYTPLHCAALDGRADSADALIEGRGGHGNKSA